VPIVLVGNKCDLDEDRAVVREKGDQLSLRWGMPFFETSARQRINVDEVFYALVKLINRQNPA
ncbi:Ras- protein Rap-1b, partial [Haplosporangium bisporale]